MVLLLKLLIWKGFACLFQYLHALPLELLLQIIFKIFELILLGDKGVPQHVYLRFLLSYFFFVDLLETNHCLMDILDLLVFVLDNRVELPFLRLKKLSPFLFLLSLTNQSLRS